MTSLNALTSRLSPARAVLALVSAGLLAALPAHADVTVVVPAPAPATPTTALPSGTTPTVASARSLPPPAVCRPGAPTVQLRSVGDATDAGEAIWTLSPCSAGVQSVQLAGPQFKMTDRAAPDGLPVWAKSKYSAGQLDLVPTWDPPWDPFQDQIVQALFAGQPTVNLVRKTATGDTPQAVPSLAVLQKAEPQWKLVASDATHATFVWPDPAQVKSPLYLSKTLTVLQKTADVGSTSQSLLVTLQAWNVGGQAQQLTLQHIVTSYQAAGGESGGLMGMFSAPPDHKGAGFWLGGKLTRFDLPGLQKSEPAERTQVGVPDWLGTDSRYFLLATIPLTGFDPKSNVTLLNRGTGGVQAQLLTPATSIPAAACVPDWFRATWPGKEPVCAAGTGASHTWTYQTFAGPKRLDLLHATGHEIVGSVDFGWFGVIARPMLWILGKAHDLTGLWPLAILLLTLLVKVVLWPFTAKSMKSMKKMQQLKPELDKMRADLEAKAKKLGQDKPDPQELNRLTFELYRTHDVNPLGGCLPMLLQMPVYIALYRTINSSVELFNQPLFGWITDLTAKDPYYVLPLVLGGVMFAQQKLTPQAGGDPAQQKMMLYFMPILFTAMMLQLPSGLTLYILANTVLSVAQTLYVNRTAKAN